MLTETMQRIVRHQIAAWLSPRPTLPENHPDTLLVGCIDARLNPKNDIGIPDGNALIYRTIAALVPPNNNGNSDLNSTLDYAINVKGIKHIAIMGHTRCGGLEACLCHGDEKLPAVHKHLESIHPSRDKIVADTTNPSHITSLEDESVRESIRHLMTYPVVREAVEAGKLDLHGWVIDTVTRDLREMDQETGQFSPMKIVAPTTATDEHAPIDTIAAVRSFKRHCNDECANPYVHAPEMLLVSDLDSRINPAIDFDIPYGKALIYRDHLTPSAPVSDGKQAALEFAIKAKGVKDIVVMGHTDNDLFKGHSQAEKLALTEDLVRQRLEKIKAIPVVAETLNDPHAGLHVRGWVIDTNRRICEMNADSHQFVPMPKSTDLLQWLDRVMGRDKPTFAGATP